METNRRVPLLLWPFYALMQLVIWILKVTGRLLGFILGIVLIVVGVLLSMTLIGAIFGVPLAILDVMLAFKSLFSRQKSFSNSDNQTV
jgi:hypothetical protein